MVVSIDSPNLLSLVPANVTAFTVNRKFLSALTSFTMYTL